jgi:hypothetical protein
MLSVQSTSDTIHPPGPGSQYKTSENFRDHEDRDAVRSAADILDVVQDHIKLRKAGAEFCGLCPLHNEKTPSFYVNPVKQVYRCHGCGAGGDVIGFVMQVERIGFQDALKLLADRYGIQLTTKPLTPTEKRSYARERQERDRERELIEHFRLVEYIPAGRAGIEFSKQSDVYKAWLRADLEHAKAMCSLIVAVIATAQRRDGLTPAAQDSVRAQQNFVR